MTVRLRSLARSLRRDLALSRRLLAREVLVVIAGVALTCPVTSGMACDEAREQARKRSRLEANGAQRANRLAQPDEAGPRR